VSASPASCDPSTILANRSNWGKASVKAFVREWEVLTAWLQYAFHFVALHSIASGGPALGAMSFPR
jgi:hypothetical protein